MKIVMMIVRKVLIGLASACITLSSCKMKKVGKEPKVESKLESVKVDLVKETLEKEMERKEIKSHLRRKITNGFSVYLEGDRIWKEGYKIEITRIGRSEVSVLGRVSYEWYAILTVSNGDEVRKIILPGNDELEIGGKKLKFTVYNLGECCIPKCGNINFISLSVNIENGRTSE